MAAQRSDLISRLQTGLCGCGTTHNALDCCARRLPEIRPRIAELGGRRVAQFHPEERRRPNLHRAALVPGPDLLHDSKSALDRSGVAVDFAATGGCSVDTDHFAVRVVERS